jgi:predicted membrane protein
MPVAILIIGALLLITAFNNSFGTLTTALETDIPGYFVWAVAIAAIMGVGYIPGMRTPSRYLLALVLMVILLTNYTQIFAGFTSFASSGATTTAGTGGTATPTASYSATNAPAAAATTTTTAATTAVAATQTLTAAQQLAANPLNPNAYVGLAAGFGGLA